MQFDINTLFPLLLQTLELGGILINYFFKKLLASKDILINKLEKNEFKFPWVEIKHIDLKFEFDNFNTDQCV